MAFNQQHQQHLTRTTGVQSSPQESVSDTQNYVSSRLDDSEWILFSPTNSCATGPRHGVNNDDILSTLSHETLNRSPVGVTNDAVYDNDDDLEDSLIDSLNDQIVENKNSIYSNDDLETRINNWRKAQIHDMLNELTSNSGGSYGPSKNSVDLEKLEFMKSWGIDDGKIRLKKNRRKCKIPKKELKDLYYGSELLKGFDNKDIKMIRKILAKLSKELTVDAQAKRDDWRDQKSFHSSYLKNLQELNLDLKLNNYNHHQLGLLHNPDLEKYLPLFIKDLIIEKKNKSLMEDRTPDIPVQTANNFWEQDLKSCNSSLMSLSTNSLMFNFNLNEFA